MNKLMCHVVAGYPTPEACLELMGGMHDIGVAAIEIQLPFSDPIADGQTIMEANDIALAGGMTTAASFELIKRARGDGVANNLYIMSYLQKVNHFGMANFCAQAVACSITGLIIPDLPYDTEEHTALQRLAAAHSLELVPVLSPGMMSERLQAILAEKPSTIYITSTKGITGNDYRPAEQLRELVSTIKQQSGATIMIGFGITTIDDVREVLAIGDVAVVGSAVIKKIQQAGNIEAALSHIKALVAA